MKQVTEEQVRRALQLADGQDVPTEAVLAIAHLVNCDCPLISGRTYSDGTRGIDRGPLSRYTRIVGQKHTSECRAQRKRWRRSCCATWNDQYHAEVCNNYGGR